MARFLINLIFVAILAAPCRAQNELRAQILNAGGQPVTNATITVHAVTRASGTRYGANEDVDASARTDAAGNFVIHGKNPFRAATMTAEAPGFAKAVFSEIPGSDEVQQLRMFEGVTVTGSVTKEGQPVANVRVGVSDVERNSKIFAIDLSAVTDADGRFRISNVPPKRDFYFFGAMESLRDKGAIPSRRIAAGADQSTVDLGEIRLADAFVLEGKIAGATGLTEIVLSREQARDQQTARSDASGAFRFTGAPAEIVSIALNVPGQRLSIHNASLNPANPTALTGRIITNKIDLLIETEPGPALAPLNISASAAAQEPLRGAEAPGPGANMFEVSGAVEGADVFVSSEGRVNDRGGYDWFYNRAQSHTNRAFTTYLPRGENPSVLVVQADNHIPWVSGPITGPTNLVIKLKAGTQPKGVVIRPNGEPATNVTVYLADSFSNTAIEDFGAVTTSQKTITDAQGRFSFMPQEGAVSLLVFDKDAGFAEIAVDELVKTGEIRLAAFGKLEGKLMVGDRAAPNEKIRLTTAPAPYHWHPRELPAFSIAFTARTDANGNFAIESVPPMWMEAGYVLPFHNGIGAPALTQTKRILIEPGKTAEVTLGGVGRAVVGRFEVEGVDLVDWTGSIQSMENIVAHDGPSDAAMKSLLEKLQKTRGDRAAEKAYQDERKSFALAARDYFASAKGAAALVASHHYFLQFGADGAFRVDDVPPGKYAITLRLLNPDPATINTRRWVVADFQTEITVPNGKGPLDLGTIKIQPNRSTPVSGNADGVVRK
jgi:uncharacterized GH25 family protein